MTHPRMNLTHHHHSPASASAVSQLHQAARTGDIIISLAGIRRYPEMIRELSCHCFTAFVAIFAFKARDVNGGYHKLGVSECVKGVKESEWIWGLGFGIWDLGFGIWDLGFGLWDWGMDPQLGGWVAGRLGGWGVGWLGAKEGPRMYGILLVSVIPCLGVAGSGELTCIRLELR